MTQNKISRRSQCVGAILILLFFAVVYRFYSLQVVEAEWFQERAHARYQTQEVLKSSRGKIMDRHGHVLAREIDAYTVVALLDPNLPNHVSHPENVAKQLAPLLDMSEDRLVELLTQDGVHQVELRPGGWLIDRELKDKIEKLQLEGITFLETTKRDYPHDNFASHIIGYVDRDGEAKLGLELELDELLQGRDGSRSYERDRKGNQLLNSVAELDEPRQGYDVQLTIDHRIQMYVEEALDEVYEAYQPEKMVAIVSDPHTGEILAMSNRPSFDPNYYSEITNYWNDAVSYAFEPGSTFKIVTFAAAIEEGIYDDHQHFESGSYRIGGDTIRDHRRGGWGKIPFLEGFQKSSNVAAVILGYERMNRNVFYHYIDRFGFGKKTEIDLPGEHPGLIKEMDSAAEIDVATMTFGQGLTVTPIQQIQAINVFANGGRLIKPYVIDAIYDRDNNEVVVNNEPVVVDPDVVTPETAQKMTELLASVVTEGTGVNFYIDGYQVAGKTGTAQKPKEGGGYHEDQFIHSFLGFAPYDDPKLSMFVAIDAPQVEESYLGGVAVAEVFKSVMQKSLHYLNVSRQVDHVVVAQETQEMLSVGDYHGLSPQEAVAEVLSAGFNVRLIGQGDSVTEQVPLPGENALPGSKVYLVAGKPRYVEMPDLSGWPLREVQDWATVIDLQLHTTGQGYVTEQDVAPGVLIRPGAELSIHLEPLSDRTP